MMIKYLMIASLAIASPAVARVHSPQERDATVRLCRVLSHQSPAVARAALAKIKASDLSDEDKDYIADMCVSYLAGVLDVTPGGSPNTI